MKILIIDAEKDIRTIINYQLSSMGHVVEEAENVEDGFEKLRVSNHDIVFADMRLQKRGMYWLFKRMDEERLKTKRIIFTGGCFNTEKEEEDHRKMCYDVLYKPWNKIELRNLLEGIWH